eukprot:TRINITY_DN59302_c0_g1_i1.p1 TRINITY_DN59302_c0_g1~~TRINITY_DN59302_c0_g1_i1.p1  ORF type:complete len:271 (+),score=15.81 TRINITY_DN59302_c0_g1_i1:117-929(+)
MGNAASEAVDSWASVSDIALYSRRMKVIPALPAECQVLALRRIWRSLRWVPSGTELLTPHQPLDRMFLVVRGELQAVLATTNYVPLLPEGSFLCEAALLRGDEGEREQGDRQDVLWALRRCRRVPTGVLDIVHEFLIGKTRWLGPRFHGRIRTTERSLIGTITRQEFLDVLEQAEDPTMAKEIFDLERGGTHAASARCNVLQNVTAYGAQAQALGTQEIAALRVVCEGPTNISCRGAVAPVMRAIPGGLGIFQSCVNPSVVETLPEARPL